MSLSYEMEIYAGYVIRILEAIDSRVSSPPYTEKRWNMNIQNFHIGDLVVTADKNLARANWPLGRIVQMFSGSDDMISVAKVKTTQGVFVQPSENLYWKDWIERFCD